MSTRNPDGPRDHPTQKPLALMAWCIRFLPSGVVADPFAGSGTTLRAAKDEGRKAIGVELDERYCEIAAKRLAQDTLFGAIA
jgi:site-specific DNA-methyltransferase (adenine-specific)